MLRLLLALALCLPAVALADAPPELPVQGVLTDDVGIAVQGPVAVRFALYTAAEGSAPVWEEDTSVVAEDGHFVAYLGRVAPIDWTIARDNASLFLGITVEDDSEMPRIPVATTAFAGFAAYAGDAATLDGFDVDGLVGEVEAGFGDSVHERYTDDEAIAAMGDNAFDNPLHHIRFSEDDARSAMGGNAFENPLNHDRYSDSEARGAMGNVIDSNPYAHDRPTASDVVDALGPVGNDNPLAHARYTDGEARTAMGPVEDANPYAHAAYTNERAREAMGAVSDNNPYAHARYTNEQALAAMGTVRDNNPYAHTRYTDANARTAIASQDIYLRNTSDTLQGNLTVTGVVRDDNSPLAVHLIKMSFYRSGNNIHYKRPNGEDVVVEVTGLVPVNTPYIRFRPSGSLEGDGTLYFNIEGSPSGACTLLHNEDDYGRRGYYFATDAGNNKTDVWDDDETLTFELAREGVPGVPIANNSSFAIMCF